MGGRGWAGWSGVGGKWDNCNSIINKYIKKNAAGCVGSLGFLVLSCFFVQVQEND